VTNSALEIKVRERINKLASNDYDNIECWQVVEAFNKAQIEWIRRQIRGGNVFQDGDEQSRRRIDDLQRLLKPSKISIVDRGIFYETQNELPADYLEYKRIDAQAVNECCEKSRPMNIYLAEEDNRATLLRDEMKKPSFEWATTFATLIDNKARIFTNDGDFEKRKKTYEDKSNPLIPYIENNYDIDINGEVPFYEFFNDYNCYLTDNGFREITRNALSRLIKDRGFETKKENIVKNDGSKTKMVYILGINIRNSTHIVKSTHGLLQAHICRVNRNISTFNTYGTTEENQVVEEQVKEE